jgi:hypothetical protein
VRVLRSATEDEMVLEFLRAEIENVPEWARSIVDRPNLEDESENERRRCLLTGRGFGWDMFLFRGFPSGVAWFDTTLTVDELSCVKYIDHDETWRRMSGGARSIPEALPNIGNQLFLDNPNADPSAVILGIASAVEEGRSFPKLILAGPLDATAEQLVLVEGHKRATAYVYGGKPAEAQALIGFSYAIKNWYWF